MKKYRNKEMEIDNRILIKRIVKELEEAVLSHKDKRTVGYTIDISRFPQMDILNGIIDKLNLHKDQDEDDLVMGVMDYFEDLPQETNNN